VIAEITSLCRRGRVNFMFGGGGGVMATALVCAALGILAVSVFIATAIRQRAAFREQFPPISDAEFLARCPPGTSPDVALKVRRIVADMLAVEYERVYPSSRFVDDLAAD
jgi:hypothetical protein